MTDLVTLRGSGGWWALTAGYRGHAASWVRGHTENMYLVVTNAALIRFSMKNISRKYLPAQADGDCEDTEVKNIRSRQVTQGVRCFWFYLLKDSDNDKRKPSVSGVITNDIRIIRRIPMCMEWFSQVIIFGSNCPVLATADSIVLIIPGHGQQAPAWGCREIIHSSLPRWIKWIGSETLGFLIAKSRKELELGRIKWKPTGTNWISFVGLNAISPG